MENFLAGERSEMIELFQHKGLEPQDAVLVIDTLLHCKPVFLDLMMVMELGGYSLPPSASSTWLRDVLLLCLSLALALSGASAAALPGLLPHDKDLSRAKGG